MENSIIPPYFSWIRIDPKDYMANGIVENNDAKLIYAYNIGLLYNKANTVSIYDYGDAEDFFDGLKEFYDELQIDLDAQDQYGVFPMHYEFFGKNKMLSVTKLTTNPTVTIIDLFYQKRNNVYDCHTYISSDEKQVTLEKLCQNYPNIRYMVDEINKL